MFILNIKPSISIHPIQITLYIAAKFALCNIFLSTSLTEMGRCEEATVAILSVLLEFITDGFIFS